MRFLSNAQLQGQPLRMKCALTGRTQDPVGFYCADRELVAMGTDSREHALKTTVQISGAAVKEMARSLGWVGPEKLEEYVIKARELGAQLEALQTVVNKDKDLKQALRKAVTSAAN